MAVATNVTVNFHPNSFKEMVIKTGERMGVEVINASIFPMAAPLLNRPIPRGIVPQEHKGKTPANKQEIYCIGCHQRASLSILNKYHGKCIK